jgi:hypothetical protein
MSAFEILITDKQREFIVTALTQCQLQSYFGADSADRPEIDILLSMFSDLNGTAKVRLNETRRFMKED